MERAQAVAVELFERKGFDAVTVEDVAAAADVSPISIYRWFGTKERLVLWDEYDPPLFERIASMLSEHEPVQAIRQALMEEIDVAFDASEELVLARSRLAVSTPEIRMASAADMDGMARGLAGLLMGGSLDDYPASVLARSVVGLLQAAIEEWVRLAGRTPLSTLIDRAFDVWEAAR